MHDELEEFREKAKAASMDKMQVMEVRGMTASTALIPSSTDEIVGKDLSPDFTWYKDNPPGQQSRSLCNVLAATGKLYRTPGGQIVELKLGNPPRLLKDAVDLEAFIRENLSVVVTKNGKIVGNSIPAVDLKVLMRSSTLQASLPVVDRITQVPTYNSEWQLTQPGYNNGPIGERYYYVGSAVEPQRTPKHILAFLASMFFKTEADRTNALALALTFLLRFMWPGKKPFGAITANKSHAGKDTVLDFASGRTQRSEVSWHHSDWALQNETVSVLADPNIGGLTIGNIRSGGAVIESSFIERLITSPDTVLQSSKRSGDGYRRQGDFVVAATANNGRFSQDLANRSLPIELQQIGDVATRMSPIGDPRHEFLPTHRTEIEAELLGLVENWKDARRPLDTVIKHPMREWCAAIGGILKVNGFEDFLANWSFQRSANDSTREALGILADSCLHGRWLRVSALVSAARDQGVISALMEPRHKESEKSMERQLGVVLSDHRDEVVHCQVDDAIRSYIIRKARNEKCGQLATVYMFEQVVATPPVVEPETPVMNQ